MSQTYCKAEMKFVDVNALSDSSISTSSQDPVSDLDLLKEDNPVATSDYATLEKNLFVLDGSKQIMDTPDDIAFYSYYESGNDCEFEVIPTIEINFSEQHTSAALTFYFVEDYPAEMKLTYYTSYGTELITKNFNPDSLIYVANQQVKNFGKVKIEFTKTNLPKQLVKLQYILYGKYIAWKDTEIKSASLTEQIDITSNEIAINTSSFEIIDERDDFNIGNEEGAWTSIQKNQAVELTENVDGTDIPLGMFYINGFTFTKNVAKFELIDAIGVLDYYTFEDGAIYENTKVSVIVKAIMDAAGWKKYTISDDIKDIELSGYLAVQSCRQALQIVAFVCGAVIDDSRSDTIKIYKPDRYISYIVGTDRKFNGSTSIALDEYVSGVSIECSKYSEASDTQEIYNDILSAGDNKIVFSGPFKPSSIITSAGVIKEVHTNYVVVTMSSESTCTIEGLPYEENNFTVSYNIDMIDAGEFENVKSFGGCTLYNATVVKQTLSSLFRYYALRKQVKMKYLEKYEKVGNWVNIKDSNNRGNASLIESQTIDLSGGFISEASCRGYTLITSSGGYFTGSELITNEGIGGALI